MSEGAAEQVVCTIKLDGAEEVAAAANAAAEAVERLANALDRLALREDTPPAEDNAADASP